MANHKRLKVGTPVKIIKYGKMASSASEYRDLHPEWIGLTGVIERLIRSNTFSGLRYWLKFDMSKTAARPVSFECAVNEFTYAQLKRIPKRAV